MHVRSPSREAVPENDGPIFSVARTCYRAAITFDVGAKVRGLGTGVDRNGAMIGRDLGGESRSIVSRLVGKVVFRAAKSLKGRGRAVGPPDKGEFRA